MQENYLFEYAVIRIVPRVEREEFLNVGVVMYCSKLQYLQVKFNINRERLSAFCGKIDLVEVKENLDDLEAELNTVVAAITAAKEAAAPAEGAPKK